MSETLEAPEAPKTIDPSVDFFSVYVPLLKEYTEKLVRGADSLDELAVTGGNRQTKLSRTIDMLRSLVRPSENLVRRVSQWVEYGNDTPSHKDELRLRLAEFEAALRGAREAVTGTRSAK